MKSLFPKILLLFGVFLLATSLPLSAHSKSDKYCICHNPSSNNPQTIVVSINAVCTHVNKHGDISGPCPGDPASDCKGSPGIDDIECNDPICGDGSCGSGETCETCPDDCDDCPGPFCGDGTCDPRETCFTCENDCGACPDFFCGDGRCSAISQEDCSNCEVDCGSCPEPHCGDDICQDSETCLTCEADCDSCTRNFCGDGVCTAPRENCTRCEIDCGACPEPHCGDGQCGGGIRPEFCLTCPEDCGACPPIITCGDGRCEYPIESCENCEVDCGACPEPHCGDETCGPLEFCLTCPSDCGNCSCDDTDGDGVCDFIDNCPDDFNPEQLDLNQNGIGDLCEHQFLPLNIEVVQCFKILRGVGFDIRTSVRLAKANVCALGGLEGSGSAFGCSLQIHRYRFE